MTLTSTTGRAAVAAALLAFLAIGCGVEPRQLLGDQCDLTSDCDAPLVCGLGRCRKECVASRDCALGLRCVLVQEDGIGVCQLEEEAPCEEGACDAPWVCDGEAGCINPCDGDLECAGGQRCGTEGVCVEEDLCVYDSDCPYPLVCSVRQQCEPECAGAADCALPRSCVQAPACAGPCMCRQPCAAREDCAPGLECVDCGDGLDCSGAERYCERPDPG